MPFAERLLKDKTHARSNMVACQLRPNGINTPNLITAFETVPQEAFVPPSAQSLVYSDADLPLTPDHKRWMLSPLTLGKLLKISNILPHEKVLVIGSGTGYSLALTAKLAKYVIGVECDENLLKQAQAYMTEEIISNVKIIGGALSVGYPKEAPYDVILLEGAVSYIPSLLLQQLAPQGRLVTVVKKPLGFGKGTLIIKIGEQLTQYEKFDASCSYLPEFEPKEKFHL